MATETPVWTDNVSVIAAASLARGSRTRATLDLRTKFKAIVYVQIGRTGTTVLTDGVIVRLRRTLNNDAIIQLDNARAETSATLAAVQSTVNADSASGQNTLSLASVATFAVGEIVCIRDSDGGFTRLEWAKIAAKTASTLVLDSPLKFTHSAANADKVTNKANSFAFEIEGGATYEVVVDYSNDESGDAVVIRALAQTHDSNATA